MATPTPPRVAMAAVTPVIEPSTASPMNTMISGEMPSRPTTTTQPAPAPARTIRRRDSLERREALLKGKEGSRQRRRWENDRLINNPYAQPPLPSDFLVPSTHPVRSVPYYLAPLWDAAEFQRAVESKLHGRKNSRTIFRKRRMEASAAGYYGGGMSPMELAATNVPKEIKSKLKWRRGGWARGLLKELEEDVRGWVGGWQEREIKEREVRNWEEQEKVLGREGRRTSALVSDTETESGTEDEEIVFVGRHGSTTSLPHRLKGEASQSTLRPEKEGPTRAKQKESGMETEDAKGVEQMISDSKLVYDGLEDDKSASFARWLVHCVGAYYGLRTWSVTNERAVEVEGKHESQKELRREAYVGIDRRARGLMGRERVVSDGDETRREIELPRPLWGMV